MPLGLEIPNFSSPQDGAHVINCVRRCDQPVLQRAPLRMHQRRGHEESSKWREATGSRDEEEEKSKEEIPPPPAISPRCPRQKVGAQDTPKGHPRLGRAAGWQCGAHDGNFGLFAATAAPLDRPGRGNEGLPWPPSSILFSGTHAAGASGTTEYEGKPVINQFCLD